MRSWAGSIETKTKKMGRRGREKEEKDRQIGNLKYR